MQALKPGGQLFITDYAKSASSPSPGFQAYIKQRAYDLHSVQEYGHLLQQAGFVDVKAEDQTPLVRISCAQTCAGGSSIILGDPISEMALACNLFLQSAHLLQKWGPLLSHVGIVVCSLGSACAWSLLQLSQTRPVLSRI